MYRKVMVLGMLCRRISELRTKYRAVNAMSRRALLRSLQVSCAILAVCLLVLVEAGEPTAHTYEKFYLAAELWRWPLLALLMGALAAAVWER